MNRRWNLLIWIGFVVVLIGLFSYELVFVHFPITRDFPWANLLLLALGLTLLAIGLSRAFRQPTVYRGKIFGSILGGISILFSAAFAFMIFYFVRQVPASTNAPHVGDKAPVFTLPDQNGRQIALADLISHNGAVLIFYRGHW